MHCKDKMDYRHSRLEHIGGLYELAYIHCTVTVSVGVGVTMSIVVTVSVAMYVCVAAVVAIFVRRITERLGPFAQS